MKVRVIPVSYFLLFSFLCSLCGSPKLFAAEGIREISITALVSPSFKENMEWQNEIRDRILFANAIFEKQFGIHFRVREHLKWVPEDEERETNLLIEEVKALAPLSADHIVMAFHKMTKAADKVMMNDVETVGTARAFSGYIVIRDPSEGLSAEDFKVVVTHELIHLFGGVHVSEKDQIMFPSVVSKPSTQIDPNNSLAIKASKNIDFRKGVESLPAESIATLVRVYEQLIRINPKSDFYYQLGHFYKQQGQVARAVATWEEAIRQQYSNPFIHRALGIHYFETGRNDLAIQELGSALGHFVLPSQQKAKAETFNAIGAAYFQQGNHDQAIFNWLKGLSSDPDNTDLQQNLAALYMEKGDLDRGSAELEKLAAKNSDNAITWNNLGIAYLRKKQYGKAAEYFSKAMQTVASQPPKEEKKELSQLSKSLGEAEIRMNIASVYSGQENWGAAIKELETVRQLNPATQYLHHALAQAYFSAKKVNEAKVEIDKALTISPKDPHLYSLLAGVQETLGQSLEAMRSARKAVSLSDDPSLKVILYRNMGVMLMRANKPQDAVVEFKNALSVQWKNADVHTQLGYVYLQLGKPEDAKRSFQSAISADPNNVDAKKGLEIIKNQPELR